MKSDIIKKMKENIAKSGSSKREVLYFPADSQHRVRFLQELDTGYSFTFHSDFNEKIFTLCKDPTDHEDCDLCKDEIGIQENYAWSVWDYDSNSVKILMFKATGVSPIPALIEMFEEFGTVMDRDYKIKKVGKGMGGSFAVTPLDKSRFRSNAKPYSYNELEDIIDKAFPYENSNSDSDEDEDDEPVKKSKKTEKKKKKSLRSKFEELSMSDLKEICLNLGISKKEFKNFEDEDEVLDELFDNYEESDLEELYNDLSDDEEDDD